MKSLLREYASLYVRPKFLNGIASHSPQESNESAQNRVMEVGFTVCSPGVSKEIAAGDPDVTGVGRGKTSVIAASHESHLDDVSHASAKRLIWHSVITRILSPYRSECRFHGISRGQTC